LIDRYQYLLYANNAESIQNLDFYLHSEVKYSYVVIACSIN